MRTLRVNLANREAAYEPLKEAYSRLGNRGLTARAALDEIPAGCDPLGPQNKLLIAQSLLANTPLTTTGRMSVGGKSPLTGGIKEANVGGMAGKALSAHGIKLLIIEEAARNGPLYILLIQADGSPQLIERPDLAGMGTYLLVEKLRAEYGESCECLVCGPAAENGFLGACLMSTEYASKEPCRAAGRGGLGAVMGSKGLKAIVIQKAAHPEKALPANSEDFKKALQTFHHSTLHHVLNQLRTKYGTFNGVIRYEAAGSLPVKNFRSLPFEALEKIHAQAVYDRINNNGGRSGQICQTGCIVKCSNYYVDDHGRHTASDMNYETLALVGTNCMLDNLDDVAEIKQLCDDFGIDTIEMGASLGLLMEAGVIPWGDGGAAKSLARQIFSGGRYAKEVAGGLTSLGESLGVTRIPAVRNQAFPGFDSRGDKGMGVLYLSGTMGADHTLGDGHPDQEGSYVRSTIDTMQLTAAFDNIFCTFAAIPMQMEEEIMGQFLNLLSAFFGETWDLEKLLRLGSDTYAFESRFNDLARAREAVMPQMFLVEPSGVDGSLFDIPEEQIQQIKSGIITRD